MRHTYKVNLYNSLFPRYIKGVTTVKEPAFGQSYILFWDEDNKMIARFRDSDVQSIERVVAQTEGAEA